MSALGTRPNAHSRYHQTKWQAEQIVRNSGLDWTIFRPSIIYGPGDQFVNRFTKIARWSPVLPVMGRGTFQPIPVREAAWCFVRALGQPASMGATLDLVGSEVLTLAEILKAILAASGRRRLIVRVPMMAARVLAWLLEAVSRISATAPPLNRDQLIMLEEENIGNPQSAIELLGLQVPRFAQEIAHPAEGVNLTNSGGAQNQILEQKDA
jgi:NADH dehydrogenase